MGGNAFKKILTEATFPRMKPAVYNALKAELQVILPQLYAHVAVSPEAPGKVSYGDLDFLVSGPREDLTHEQVKAALRATASAPTEGERISNYAIPVDAFETVARAFAETSELTTADKDKNKQIFLQVDINFCLDQAQLERTVFYSSYGDLGFFLGLLAHSAGLSFNNFGLKLANALPTYPPQTYYLSSSMNDIVTFFGLSMDRWEQGFATQEDIFAWVATSPFVVSLIAKYRTPDYEPSEKDRAYVRPMRDAFIKYLQTQDIDTSVHTSDFAKLMATSGNQEQKIEAALHYFGKAEERTALLYAAKAFVRAKDIMNGNVVGEWTGLYGMPVKLIRDEMKVRLAARLETQEGKPPAGAEEVPAWKAALLSVPDEDVRTLAIEVKEDLAKADKLFFDWRAIKAAKDEAKRQEELEGRQLLEAEGQGVAVSVA